MAVCCGGFQPRFPHRSEIYQSLINLLNHFETCYVEVSPVSAS